MNHKNPLISRLTQRPFGLRLLLAFFVALAILIILVGAIEPAPAQQPLAFDHKVMVGKGINCLFCHSGAIRSETAGIPSIQLCMGCHKTNDKNDPEVAKLMDFWNQQQTIPWVRINTLPRFVYFSHQAHVVGGSLNCEQCHGDISQMSVVKPVYRMNMGWCLDCHNQQPNAQKITSCETCHR